MNSKLFYIGLGIVGIALVVAARLHHKTVAVDHPRAVTGAGTINAAEGGLHLKDARPFAPQAQKPAVLPQDLPPPKPAPALVLPPCPASPMCVDANGEAWDAPKPGSIPGRIEIDPANRWPVGSDHPTDTTEIPH